MKEVFEIRPSKKITEKGKAYFTDDEIIDIGGKIPYLAATSKNNGIAGYSNRAPNNKGDCITVATAAVASDTVFYQENDFIGRLQVSTIRRIDKRHRRTG